MATELRALRRPELLLALLSSTLIIGATFSVFSFLTPVLTRLTGFGEGAVPLLLLAYGAATALITAYLSQADPHEKYSLRRTVTGYRRWRAQLPGRSFHGRQLDPGPALSEAFTGVVLAPDRAAPPAHVLSHLLVAGAERSADTGQGIRTV